MLGKDVYPHNLEVRPHSLEIPTLPLTLFPCVGLPTHDARSETLEDVVIYRFGKVVSALIFRPNLVYRDCAAVNVGAEVMELAVEMFGARTIFVCLRHLQRA